MGRFDTLNDETKDMVECILPPLAASFKVSDVVHIIPEDIRMRQWDVSRRDHIKDKTENNPRNWGVQFLKDLKTIARITGGDLDRFQSDLREKVELHADKHPWARLADIKDIRLDYENPGRKERLANPVPISSEDSSTDSYLEELVELDCPTGSKRKLGRHEVYEARVQESAKRRKNARLRRADGGGFVRKEKGGKKQQSEDRATPSNGSHSLRRGSSIIAHRRQSSTNAHRQQSRVIESDGEDSYGSPGVQPSYPQDSPTPFHPQPDYVQAVNASNEPLAVQRLEAELEVAEAELKAARLKHQYIQALEQAEQEQQAGQVSSYGSTGF